MVLLEVGRRPRQSLINVFLSVQIVIEKFIAVYCSFLVKIRNVNRVNCGKPKPMLMEW